MNYYELGEKELQFSKIIWSNEPLSSGELVKLCETQLQWKKSTTYTILKKLCTIGYFSNEQSIVTSKISYEKYKSMQSRNFISDAFNGSLPKFLTAFVGRNKISEEEFYALKQMIDEYEEEKK